MSSRTMKSEIFSPSFCLIVLKDDRKILVSVAGNSDFSYAAISRVALHFCWSVSETLRNFLYILSSLIRDNKYRSRFASCKFASLTYWANLSKNRHMSSSVLYGWGVAIFMVYAVLQLDLCVM